MRNSPVMGIGSYGLPSQSHTLGNSVSDGEANSLRQNVLNSINPDHHHQSATAPSLSIDATTRLTGGCLRSRIYPLPLACYSLPRATSALLCETSKIAELTRGCNATAMACAAGILLYAETKQTTNLCFAFRSTC